MLKKSKELPFIITLSFLCGFIFIRLAVFLAGSADTVFAEAAKLGELPDQYFHIGSNIILFGHHIHHFYFGVAMIAVAGWLALVGSEFFTKQVLASIYGFGLGLFMDEIGLLLTWGDYYSRLSYLLSVLLAGIFLNIVFFHDYWVSIRDNLISSTFYQLVQKSFLRPDSFLKLADRISQTTGQTEKTALVFSGLIYLGAGLLVIRYPAIIRAAIMLIFFLQGTNYLVQFFYSGSDKGEDPTI